MHQARYKCMVQSFTRHGHGMGQTWRTLVWENCANLPSTKSVTLTRDCARVRPSSFLVLLCAYALLRLHLAFRSACPLYVLPDHSRSCTCASSMGEKHSTGTRPKFIVYSRISSTSSASAAPNRGPWRRDVPSEPPHSAQQCLPGLPRSRSPAAAFPRTHAPGSSGGRDFSRY